MSCSGFESPLSAVPAPGRRRCGWLGAVLFASLGLVACEGTTGAKGDMNMPMTPGPGMTQPDAGLVPAPNPNPNPNPNPPSSNGVIEPTDIEGLSALLTQGKLPGWIHAAVHGRGLYVFTYRKPGNFFSFADFPLVAANNDVATKLATVKRHDAVTLKGLFLQNMAPIRHIKVEEVTVTRTYTADETPPARTAATRIPDELVGKTELIGKVHAVAADGRILVIEYGDAVLPVFVRTDGLTRNLWRNDKIKLHYTISAVPPRPIHIYADTTKPNPIEVLERLVDRHMQPYETEGALIRFPKSPQISVDVYAVQVVDADNVSREYTLLHPDNATIFEAIRQKLHSAWISRPGQGVDARNKLINPKIKVKVKGTFNIIDRNQANAQIYLNSPDDITITYLP